MHMAQFSIVDGFVPELFATEVMNKATDTNRLINSGILTPDPVLGGQLLQSGEDFMTVGFNNDLYGDAQVWSEDSDIQVNNFNSSKERTFRMRQAQAFGYTDLAQLKTASDPQGEIQSRFADYWNREDEKIVIAMLTGIFAQEDMLNFRTFDDAKNKFSARGILATKNKLGDLASNTNLKILVNSSVYSEMKAQQLIDFVQPNGAVTEFGTYNGSEIVVDDKIPVNSDGTTTVYLVAANQIAYSIANPANAAEIERQARAGGGRWNIINRRVLTTHLLGTTVNDTFQPSNAGGVTVADLSNPAMWAIKRDIRNVQAVAYKTSVSSDFIPKTKGQSATTATATASTSGSGK